MGVSARRGVASVAGTGQVLAYRQKCQRLDQRTPESLAEVVSAVGFVPTTGGATPYLALRARSPRHDRRLVDRAVFDAGELVDVPFARGTSVLAPAPEAGIALAAARRSHEQKLQPLAARLDARRLQKLEEAILSALGEGPLAADDLRARLPEPLCVTLGEAGRKAGFASLFSVALRELQLDGRVLRRQKDVRLDRDGFAWAAPKRALATVERGDALTALARRYFRAYAPSPVAAFAWWADANVSEARQVVADAELVPVTVEGSREPYYLGAEQLEDFLAFDAPVPPRLAFVPFRDPYVSGARDLKGLLAEEHRERALADWRGRLVPAGGGSAVHQHFVLMGGHVAGVWEYDEGERRVRYALFDTLPTRMRRAVDELAQELEQYVSHEVGHARFHAGEEGEGFGRLDALLQKWGGAGTART